MGMSNAERQRKFRENRNKDAHKREAYLKQEKERYLKDKRTGKKKSIKDMTTREQRSARKKWRQAKQKEREAKKHVDRITAITPPNTPDPSPTLPQPEPSRQKVQSDKKRNRDKAKCYRDNKKLERDLEIERKKSDKYRQKYYRLLNQNKPADTPRTKTKKLLRNFSKKEVRKTLIFHYAMEQQFKETYKNLKDKSEKRKMAGILQGSILRRYKFKTMAFGNCNIDVRNTLKSRTSLSKRICKPIREFYERSDVSRIATGLKQTVTLKKIKRQRRVLLDSLQNLHLKFLSEANIKVSYTTFCRLRPFWVVYPNESDRHTCLCKLCENTKFIASALRKDKVIETDDLEKILNSITCAKADFMHKRKCMFNECPECKNNRVFYDESKRNDEIEIVQWVTQVEKRLVKDKEKDVTITVKKSSVMRVSSLMDKFDEEMVRFKKHTFITRSQYQFFKNRKSSLKKDECLLHIDFSENYVCKLAEEIQSMHFGASKKQLSLHTGIYYTSEVQKTFCTVSENLHHGPAAIWAHLKPILKQIKLNSPQIKSVEIFSDGPTSQYRQKANFYLACTNLPKYGFEKMEWNFFEAGHGKGIPDAVGGALKRKADSEVKYGKDISNASDFVHCLTTSNSFTCIILERDIQKEQNSLQNVSLRPIPGTMKLHQLSFHPNHLIKYRNISCTCHSPSSCGYCTDQEIKESRIVEGKITVKKCKKKHKTETCELEPPHPETETEEVSQPEFDFDGVLENIKTIKSYNQLKIKCQQLAKKVSSISGKPWKANIMDYRMEVDALAMDIYPNDIPDSRALYPCKVVSDGNCLPACGSVFAHTTDKKTSDIRLRIIIELVLNEDLYLDSAFLLKGSSEPSTCLRNLPKIYAQYSDVYVPGIHLTENIIRSIFQKEIMKIRTNQTYMGIWQIHGLASVLKTPIYSVYPKLGNQNVRKDLNRLIIPRVEIKEAKPVYIFWTSTRSNEMTREHWVPNHFVPVLPIDYVEDIATLETMECEDKIKSHENDESEKDTFENTATNTEKENSIETNERIVNENLELETDITIENEGNEENTDVNENVENEQAEASDDILNPKKYVGKYVIIKYKNKPYPGIVEDAGESDIYVQCMHRVGKKNNCFFWPRAIKDLCWYELDNVLALIPEPIKLQGSNFHYQIDDEIWEKVLQEIN